MYNYIKALHIIFVVTWFSGLFYIVRLFIYHAEANDKPEPEKSILQAQLAIMMRRLWLGITWPSALLTLVFGGLVWSRLGTLPSWLAIKLLFVAGLYGYHLTLQFIYRRQISGDFPYSSQQLRVWNELATVFLFAIVFIAVVKDSMSWLKGLAGLAALVLVLMAGMRLYKAIRSRPK